MATFTTPKESITYSKHLAVWSINNFTELKDKYEDLKSVDFPLCDCMWKLNIKPNFEYDKNKEKCFYFGVKLESNVAINVQYDLGMLNKEGKNTNKFTSMQNFVPNDLFRGGCIVRLSEFNKLKHELWPNDKLTVVCNIKLTEDNVETKCQLIGDFGLILENEMFSDVTLNIGLSKFKAHRNVLALRSEYFKELLNNDTISIRIDNTDVNVFSFILKYIYTGVLDKTDVILKKYTKKLFIAANKFKLNELKLICETEFSESMSIETIVDIYIFAHNYSAINVKVAANDFIRSHFRNVELTNGWKVLLQNYSKFVIEILSQIVRDLSVK